MYTEDSADATETQSFEVQLLSLLFESVVFASMQCRLLVDKPGSDSVEHLSSYRRKCNSDECREDEDLLILCAPDR